MGQRFAPDRHGLAMAGASVASRVAAMLIAHLPTGYLLSRATRDKTCAAALMVGSVVPDLDLLYFYALSTRSVSHHAYFTHLPAFWLAVSVVGVWHPVMRAFLGGVWVHLVLDTLAGGIFWLWPLDPHVCVWVDVPARYNPWILNFIFHWSFAVEGVLVAMAAASFISMRRAKLSGRLQRYR